MHVVEKTIWIDREPGDVFAFHSDHANRAGWHDHVTRSEMITPGPIRVGSRFNVDTITAGRPVPMEIEITAMDAPRSYSYRSYAANVISDSHQAFEPENGGTRFHVRIELNARGVLKPFGGLILKLGLEKHFAEALRELKEALE